MKLRDVFLIAVAVGMIIGFIWSYIEDNSCEYGSPYNCLDLVVPPSPKP